MPTAVAPAASHPVHLAMIASHIAGTRQGGQWLRRGDEILQLSPRSWLLAAALLLLIALASAPALPPKNVTITEVFSASHGVFSPVQPIPAACQAKLDAFCNSESLNGQQCLDPLRLRFGARVLPLVALYDRGVNHTASAWGCYSHAAVVALPHPHWDAASLAYCTEHPVAASATPINGSCHLDFSDSVAGTLKSYKAALPHTVCATTGDCSSLTLEWCGNECHRLGFSLAGVEAEHVCEVPNFRTAASSTLSS